MVAPGLDGELTSYMYTTRSMSGSPSMPWLSPLDHRDAFFQVAEPGETLPANGHPWRIPADQVQAARIIVPPDFPAGSSLVRLEFPFSQLREYVAPPWKPKN